jgi:L-fuculose-phosphate aldolase
MKESDEYRLRRRIVETMTAMEARGLNRGTTGNVSARFADGMLITPSGVVPEKLTPDSIVPMDASGTVRAGGLNPSSEWKMHARIYELREDAHAIVHCHARYATILACAGKSIPPLHYMVGVSGKSEVPLAPYATFGTTELAENVSHALAGGNACLMANHGLIALAPNLTRALLIAQEIEEQAAVYWGTLAIGGPTLLSADRMDEIFRRFETYGQSRRKSE